MPFAQLQLQISYLSFPTAVNQGEEHFVCNCDDTNGCEGAAWRSRQIDPSTGHKGPIVLYTFVGNATLGLQPLPPVAPL